MLNSLRSRSGSGVQPYGSQAGLKGGKRRGGRPKLDLTGPLIQSEALCCAAHWTAGGRVHAGSCSGGNFCFVVSQWLGMPNLVR